MNLFFEESGSFLAGTVLSQQGEAYQVELASGKRSKVKAKEILFQFASPDPATLLDKAKAVAKDIDVDFLWEVAGESEFTFSDLGQEYFGHALLPEESAGLLFCLHGAPMYFYKKGRGVYKPAPEAALKAALASIEKKKQQAIIQEQYVTMLKSQQLPETFKPMVWQLLFKPDKNSIEYKAFDAACKEMQLTPERLMLLVGGIGSARELHYRKFLFEYFPKGVGFPQVGIPSIASLPTASVKAFSIDDVTTTEIDDAISVTVLSDELMKVGIHIAAPGLGIHPEDAIDEIARNRMSTVYMPGEKITMLPDALVNTFTLDEGAARPALSLYATVNRLDLTVVETETKAELVPIAANLRHNDLDDIVTEEALADGSGDYPHKEEINLLWRWIQMLESGRMQKREAFGLRPEQNNRVDFNFYVENDVVSIIRRKRGAPLDKIVAELMIFANSTWGKYMGDHGVPGIYRAQGIGNGGWAAKKQVKMVTHPAPHQGLGVDQYAWSTSPLRRYTDLVNQWQILACLEHGVAAPLAAPFKPKDATLFSIVSAFDATYAGYGSFQSEMERYWCLRWLAQEKAHIVDAVVLKDELVRLVDIPLVIRLSAMPSLPRGQQVKLEIISWDEVDLTVEARLLDVIATEIVEDMSEEDDSDVSSEEQSPETGDASEGDASS